MKKHTYREDDLLDPPAVESSCEPNLNCNSSKRTHLPIIAAYLACILIWGTAWNAVRLCVLPGGLSPFTAAALRFFFATILLSLLWAVGIFRARPKSARSAGWIAGTAVLGVISMALVYYGQRSVSGGLAAILATTSPLMMALLATVTRSERVSTASVAGAIVSLTGIAIIFGERLRASSDQAIGILCLLGSLLINTLNGIILKKHAADDHPFVTVAVFSFVSLMSFAPLSLLLEPTDLSHIGTVPLIASMYLGVAGTVCSFACYIYLLKRVRLMTISTMVFFPPVITLLIDSFIEKQVVLSSLTYAGIAVTILGVLIGVLRTNSTKSA